MNKGSTETEIVLRCTGCDREHPLGTKSCGCHGGILKPVVDLPGEEGLIVREGEPGIWRYASVLPPVKKRVSHREGLTPVLESKRLGDEISVDLTYKDETRNPTGSFKDRAGAVMLSVASERSVSQITTASSGNAAGAIALYSLLSDVEANIYMYKPSQQKLSQTLSYGANVYIVDTPDEGTVLSLAEKASSELGWTLLNTTAATNPMVSEGYKTISYELWEEGRSPDWISIPVSSGSLLLGVHRGFSELERIGCMNNTPKLLGVQSSGVQPIVEAFDRGRDFVKPSKRADSIATALSLENPGTSGVETLRSVRSSGGAMVAVEDDSLIEATRKLAAKDGIYSEPSGAISLAGTIEAIEAGIIEEGDSVLCLITGGGLKDPSGFEGEGSPSARVINNSLSSIKERLE